MTMARAVWTLELNCECPKCEKEVDVVDTPDLFDRFMPCESKKDVGVVCPECGHEFVVETVY